MSAAGLYGCPICGQGLTPEELPGHFTQELDMLTKLTLSMIRSSPDLVKQRFSFSPGMEHAPRNRWEVSRDII